MEKIIIFENFEIKYTDKDEKYIQLIIQELKNNYLNIINFFNLEKIDTNCIYSHPLLFCLICIK